MKRRAFLPLAVGIPFGAAVPGRAQPQEAEARWNPDRPVRLIVGFAAGGSTDTVARVLAQALTAELKQSVVVENRTGAAGNIASEYVARSAPDGHTLVVASLGTHVTNAALYRDMPFDVVRDFSPISLICLSSCLLVVHPSLPVHDVAGLVARAKAAPGALNCGTAGVGSSQHFAATLFESRAGVRFSQVAYRGGAPAMTDLVAGRLDLMFTPVAEAIQQVRAGQVRTLGTTGRTRVADLPDAPPIGEALEGYAFNSWVALFAPAGAPAPVVARLSGAVGASMRAPGTRARMEQLGYGPVGGTPAELAALQAAELPRVAELLRASGVEPGRLD